MADTFFPRNRTNREVLAHLRAELKQLQEIARSSLDRRSPNLARDIEAVQAQKAKIEFYRDNMGI